MKSAAYVNELSTLCSHSSKFSGKNRAYTKTEYRSHTRRIVGLKAPVETADIQPTRLVDYLNKCKSPLIHDNSSIRPQHIKDKIAQSNRVRSNVKTTSCITLENHNASKPTITHRTMKNKLNVCLWNAQSLRNKTDCIYEYRKDNDIDLFLFTESWLKEEDIMTIGELECQDECQLLMVPRENRTGGGVACLFKSELKVSKIKTPSTRTFEHMELKVVNKNKLITLLIVYRPEPSYKNYYRMSDFFDEFTTWLTPYNKNNNDLLIVGDFNFHVNKPNNHNAKQFLTIIDNFNLSQNVSQPTHSSGNTLDLIITSNTNMVSNILVDELNSDHNCINFKLNTAKPPPARKLIKYRKVRDIDLVNFKADLIELFQNKTNVDPNTPQYLETLVSAFNDSSKIFARHAPEMTKWVTVRNPTPWTTNDIILQKREKRKAERKWKKTRLPVDYQIFKEKRNNYNMLLRQLRSKHLSETISRHRGDSRAMFKALNTALHRKRPSRMPPDTDDCTLAEEFSTFFKEKIQKIRDKLDDIDVQPQNDQRNSTRHTKLMTDFKQLTEAEVEKLIRASPTKHCQLDPVPMWLFKECIKEFLPIVTEILNCSLKTGVMPDQLKQAIIKPQLKKAGLETTLKNYRPVSNLPFLGKLIESAAIQQYTTHLETNKLNDNRQSAYKKFHSTETLLTKIHNDIVSNIAKGEVTIMLLLDLSAAFDTIDHDILLNRLHNNYGLRDNALQWFRSYLSNRYQSVVVNDEI